MAENKPLVSVIMPVFNAGEYLRGAVCSVLEQSMTDFELILADDGSYDGSGEECEEFLRKDKRVRVIHTDNCGAGQARNAGLKEAKGKYVYFADADDYIEKETLKENIELAEKTGSDIVLFGLYIESQNEKGDVLSSRPWVCGIEGVFEKGDLVGSHFYEFFKTRPLTHCVRIYRRDFLERYGFRFGSQPMGEDRLFVLQADRADNFKMAISRKAYYHYAQRGKSAIRRYYAGGYARFGLAVAEEFERIAEKAGIKGKREQGLADLRFGEVVLYELQNITRQGCELGRKEKKEIIKGLMKNKRIKQGIYNVPLREVNGWFSRMTVILLRLRAYELVFLLKRFW